MWPSEGCAIRAPRTSDRGPRRMAYGLPCQRRLPQCCPRNVEVKIWPGKPYPLGATHDGAGTNFSLFSEVATRVELCLFDERGVQACVDLPEVIGFIWHGYLPNVGPGQRYGYRVHGPWEPKSGQRCNPSKLLLDPYGKAVEGEGNGE